MSHPQLLNLATFVKEVFDSMFSFKSDKITTF